MKTVFEDVLRSMRETGTQQDDSLLAPVTFVSFDPSRVEITLSFPSSFYKEQFVRRYQERVARELEARHKVRPTIVCRVTPAASLEQMPLPAMPEGGNGGNGKVAAPRPTVPGSPPLNANLSFERFVTGPSNQFAYTYAMSVADSPGRDFNPLYLYGGSGLGKTHLLCAVALRLRERHPHLRVIYQTAEEFTNRMIAHIQRKKDAAFRDSYRRHCDVLLIDDIQFISGKERTTEEFFHIFNALYTRQKQIVLTSDLNPKELPGIPERLRSRFAVGLIADIQPPELETRVAILKEKCRTEGVHLDDEVVFYIASVCTEHVRQLEGAIRQLRAYGSLIKGEITVEVARRLLHGTRSETPRPVTMDGILKAVASYHGVTVAELKGPRKQKSIAVPRQQAMYLARKLTTLSFPEIGRRVGDRDHTTVMHAERKIAREVQESPELQRILTAIEEIARQKS